MADIHQLAPLLDIPLEVEATLEGPKMRVRELLGLALGNTIVTRRPAGESIDILAGKTPFGVGELGVVGGRRVVRVVKFKGKG